MGVSPGPTQHSNWEAKMTKSMLFFIAVLLVALGARSVLAADDREYVGETEATTVPNIGIITMHDLCNASFPAARMCSSSDIIRGGGVKADPPPRALSPFAKRFFEKRAVECSGWWRSPTR